MSDIIKLLPDAVANQIAAGEVIQRPASVIKELVENAIDAGATHIQIIIKDAGRTLIQVIDNGKGMSCTDARMAFERHATSKIRKADDLFALSTMGFRGEALASIAAIAQIELKTRCTGEEMGTSIVLSGSKIESQEPVSCPEGSNFAVKNIFFNVPARRKFLKSNQTELSNILSEFERIALVNPQVAFELRHNEVELFNLPKSNLRQRIVSLFGKTMNQQLLAVEVETSLVSISGYVGRPESARKRNALQYLFVNGRYMRHPYFHKAVLQSYEQLLPIGEMPNYFLYFKVDPATIDVNIHPTKTEIKFENEQPIWQIIAAAVRESLGKFNAVPSIDFDMTDAPDIPVINQKKEVLVPNSSYNTAYNPFREAGTSKKRPEFQWSDLYEGFEKSKEIVVPDDQEIVVSKATSAPNDSVPVFQPVQQQMTIPENIPSKMNMQSAVSYFQIKGRYIVSTIKSGIMFIDQHRAHVRVLFDRYMTYIVNKQGVSQRVLFPQMVQFSAAQAALLTEVLEDISWLGFDLSDMGKNTYAINAIPAGTEGMDAVSMIRKMVETAGEKGRDVKTDQQEQLALALAEAAATPYGEVLSNEEMERLVDDLLVCTTPNYTPDGKVTLSVMTSEELDKRFK